MKHFRQLLFLLTLSLTFYLAFTNFGTGLKAYDLPQAVKHPIDWATEHARIQADDFSITVGRESFFGIPDPGTTISIHSDPPNPPSDDYTTLEVIWTEKNVPMRLFIYFYRNDAIGWFTPEIRTYDGSTGGEWIYYQNGFIGNIDANGKPFKAQSITFRGEPLKKSLLRFENLILDAFLEQ